MRSRVSEEEMKKRRDLDQIALDNMIAEGGSIFNKYNEKLEKNGKNEE